ncbi:DsrE family protein [Sulfurovum sp. ST-21]|uniref:DsrE family protein n=1 Tax=Sulfurovum indicum TaxID=2779528 RepID=A0A7M1S2D0_9BACT|nr:DsrE family protein [Sulfurovum indicum]QOR61486.1 DsrE family protein [Sulfurovum indicum]
MKHIIISILLLFTYSNADTEFADPKPSIDNPRQFIFPITSGDEHQISHVLSSASNVMKFYGPEKCEIVIVCYSQGIKTVLSKAYFFDKDIQKRVRSLMTYDVEFIACGNTMKTYGIGKNELLKGVDVVTAGIVELIERQLRGYIYIRP